MVALQQMAVLCIIMIIGYIAYKRKLITDEVAKKLSGIVINIANPALILSSVIGDNSRIQKEDVMLTVLVAVVMFAGLILVAGILPYLLGVKKEEYGAYRVMTVFSNIGFMGFPIISSLFGSGALLYASIFLVPYNLLVYTYGIWIMKKKDTDSTNAQSGLLGKIKQICNIGVIMSILAIIIYWFQLFFPLWINTSITMLSNMTAPLSMMIIGAGMAVIDMKKMFTDKRLLIFSLLKLLPFPIIGISILKLFTDNSMLLGVTMVMLAVPAGSMTSMLAQQYNGDYELTTEGVTLTTILSVVTLPLVSFLIK